VDSVTSKGSFTPDLYEERVMDMILNQMLIEI